MKLESAVASKTEELKRLRERQARFHKLIERNHKRRKQNPLTIELPFTMVAVKGQGQIQAFSHRSKSEGSLVLPAKFDVTDASAVVEECMAGLPELPKKEKGSTKRKAKKGGKK